jgi:hypothetical protein
MDLPAPGTSAWVLDEPARALLVALHVAHHLGDEEPSIKALADLRRAVAKAPREAWNDAASLARTLRADPQMSRGLHALPEGSVLASRLGLPEPSSQRNEAAGFERFAASTSLVGRARLLSRVLLPSPSYLRWTSKLARRGRLGFALAYLLHPLDVVFHAPRGYFVWRRARQHALAAERADRVGASQGQPRPTEAGTNGHPGISPSP